MLDILEKDLLSLVDNVKEVDPASFKEFTRQREEMVVDIERIQDKHAPEVEKSLDVEKERAWGIDL